MKKQFTILLTTIVTIAIFTIVACEKKEVEIQGYAPIYADKNNMYKIEAQAIKPIVNGGKIYVYQDFAFQVEVGEGIHIMNISDLNNPTKIGFIKIPGCSEISIQNNVLYTNNFSDLVGINLSDIQNPKVISRIEKVFTLPNQDAPEESGVYFE